MTESVGMALTILLPVMNEGINLKVMLQMLRAVVKEEHEVVVVVDRPDDTSIEVVEKIKSEYPELRWIHNQIGRGVVNAIRAGVETARGDNILIFAADEVGPVLAIEDMMVLMREEGCDFVSCTRYAHGGRRLGGSVIGGFLSRCANRLFHVLTGSPFTDATTGIKMFRREVFGRLDLRCKPVGWAVAFEMAIKAQHAGLKLGEVPIVSIDRLYGGESTFRLGSWVKEYSRWFLWGVKESFQNKPGVTKTVKVRVPSFYR
jgi:glycosyltransferase involved in cell wall biosynthesis